MVAHPVDMGGVTVGFSEGIDRPRFMSSCFVCPTTFLQFINFWTKSYGLIDDPHTGLWGPVQPH